MTESEAKDYALKLRRFAYSQGLDARKVDDFVQHTLLSYVAGRSTATKYKYLLVDFLRIHGGGFKKKCSQDAMRGVVTDLSGAASRRFGTTKLSSELDFKESLDGLTQLQRACVILRYKWGLATLEIGEVFEMSDSSVSACIARALGRITSVHGL